MIVTHAPNHTALIGQTIILDGHVCRIIDTTQSTTGTVYVAVAPLEAEASYLESNWQPLPTEESER